MEDASRAREATRDAIADVVPARLNEHIEARLDSTAVTPGLVTWTTGQAAAEGGDFDPEELGRRAAGVQLIYEGLSLTRSLARDPPWEEDHDSSADMDVLVADVLVARGFYLLARTDAAPTAVEAVRSFGYDETVREIDPAADGFAKLEADIFELAIVAGVSATETAAPAETRAFAADLATAYETNGRGTLSEATKTALGELVSEDGPVTRPRDQDWIQTESTDT